MPRYQAIFLSGDYFWKEKKSQLMKIGYSCINIASPLKKKFTTIDPTTGPEGQLRTGGWRFFFGGAGGWRFFFGGGGSTWFSGRTKWASVVANRVKRLSYRILTANERGL